MLELFFEEIKSIFTLNEKVSSAFNRMGLYNLRDLLFYLPYSYQFKYINPNLCGLKEGQIIQTEVIIKEILSSSSKKSPLKILVLNNTGNILLVFFNKIHPFIFSKLKVGSKHIISGKVQIFDNFVQITHPEFVLKKELENPYEPIYHLTYGITNKQLYSYILRGINIVENISLDKKDNNIIKNFINEIMKEISIIHLYHFNEKINDIDKLWEKSRKILSIKELLYNQILLNKIYWSKNSRTNQQISKSHDLQKKVLNKLSLILTESQLKVITEIEQDQLKPLQMIRLLQGDVGAGKTVVSLMAIINIAVNNQQTVLLVPTDLLANQHFKFFTFALENENIKIALLTGKTTAKEKRKIKEQLANGEIHILIGTHALLQEDVSFKQLVFVVIDEQHKFGVEQRSKLINKAYNPDILFMTATPIPRSLTLTMFGDMDVSKLLGKPYNRLPIITTKWPNSKIIEVIDSLDRKIQRGEKIFWICPLIENKEEESINLNNNINDVTTRFSSLDKYYPGKVAIMHGKMRADEKDHIMNQFREGNIQILVATTVVEVGIDIPDATLIIIENAEQFGLAQLHQLRGRVGRGILQSHCILIYNPFRLSNEGKTRLEIMKTSNDGFYIAEQDMLLRGSGELLGAKQSGMPEFFFSDLAKDIKILEEVSVKAKTIEIDDNIKFQIKFFSKNTNNLLISH